MTRALDLGVAALDPGEAQALREGLHVAPHAVLGPHRIGKEPGFVVRAWHPDAVHAELVPARGAASQMASLGGGLFALVLPNAERAPAYRLRFVQPDGTSHERADPYRFPPVLAAADLQRFTGGLHPFVWRMLGAHPCRRSGVRGTRFAVWAPHARAVRVVGEFCRWDGRVLPMSSRGESGVWELFVPGVEPGMLYKFEIVTPEGQLRLKTDPYAFALEPPPQTASVVTAPSRYRWRDSKWMRERRGRDARRAPIAIYEVHPGSWDRDGHGGLLGWRELAPRLIAHARRFGFTHLELLPIAEHAFYGSWGYQVTGYYAPTSRYGTADDLRFFVDECHRHGIGVLADWVPAHFPKDDWALRRFDGRALYEPEDPRVGEHPSWGTLVFDHAKPQVRSFLIANALYWLKEFHFDGLRVDAVSFMLYLDYGRAPGEWVPNEHGGRENLAGIAMLRMLNDAVPRYAPGAITVAEEATAWPQVTAPSDAGGLGFTSKWNMGWMNDTLAYFALDPIHRKHHQHRLTFAMTYESSECFVNALSHDEVVHLKRSLLEKMPGDEWQKFANLRLLLAYQYTRPGKKLLFMGTELAPPREWNHDRGLDWDLWRDPRRAKFAAFVEELGAVYLRHAPLWRRDHERGGYAWIDGSDHERSILSWARRDGDDHVVVVLNLTPVPRPGYRVGLPAGGRYVELLSTDAERFGGSGWPTLPEVESEPVAFMGWSQSALLDLPPLAALLLVPASVSFVQEPPAGSLP